MKAVVFGASGYGGQVLMRLLMGHPGVEKVLPVSSSSAGSAIDLRDGGLGPDPLGKLPPGRRLLTRDEALAEAPDAVFSALPHGASAEFCRPFFGKSVVFDLSADFRLRGADVHAAAYGQAAPFPELRSSAVYGLSEWYADDIRGADIIAVPGCYPTCSLLPLLPLAKAGLLGSSSQVITINALSGISGAGRSAKENSLFVERAENTVAYSPGTSHRHSPEMVQELRAGGAAASVFFTPHLVPMRRGMEATITVVLEGETAELHSRVGNALNGSYSDSLFVRLTGSKIPSSRNVVGSNRCDIGWHLAPFPQDADGMRPGSAPAGGTQLRGAAQGGRPAGGNGGAAQGRQPDGGNGGAAPSGGKGPHSV